jgi:hypothetical protein
MNREQRRQLDKKLKPVAKRIVELEKQIKAGVNREKAEEEISFIMNNLTLIEMYALEEYIYKRNLLNNREKDDLSS